MIIDSIKEKIEHELQASSVAKNELTGKRVVISIIEGAKVLVKIFNVLPKVKRTIAESKEREAIKVIKQSVKVNTDITYILTLIDDVKTSINSLNFKYITNEAAQEIRHNIESLDVILGKVTLKIDKMPDNRIEDKNGN